MEIRYEDPDSGLFAALDLLAREGVTENSRNGPVIRLPEPTMLVNLYPANRVSFLDSRDANPTFHFMEALWMLAGMNEVAPLKFYNSNIGSYSDDGLTLRGTAYGYKWRRHFGYDQLELAIARLLKNPEDRRIVMTMWDPKTEWRDETSKDLSCNLQVIFSTVERDGERQLDMTVTNRSNDLVWGCLGSNVFHFSFLLEYVASRTGLAIGRYYQFAANLHGYLENEVFKRVRADFVKNVGQAPDRMGPVKISQLGKLGLNSSPEQLEDFVRTGNPGGSEYLRRVGSPLVEAYRIFKLKTAGITVDKNKRLEFACEIAAQCADADLGAASVRWYTRKMGA